MVNVLVLGMFGDGNFLHNNYTSVSHMDNFYNSLFYRYWAAICSMYTLFKVTIFP